MPLIKSKSDKAFKSNIKAEIGAGKPQKQAVAIAYATKRAAKKAIGGRMSSNPHDYDSDVDFYAAQKRNAYNAKYPKAIEPSSKPTEQDIEADFMNPAERRFRAEQARLAKQKPMSKSQGMDFLKGVREGMEKMHQKKAKGGGLYANINAKRERIAEGSGEKMRKVGSKGAPTADAFKQSAKTAKMKSGGSAKKTCW